MCSVLYVISARRIARPIPSRKIYPPTVGVSSRGSWELEGIVAQNCLENVLIAEQSLTTNGYAILGTLPGFVRIVIFGATALVALDLRAGAVDRDIDDRAAAGAATLPDNPRFFFCG